MLLFLAEIVDYFSIICSLHCLVDSVGRVFCTRLSTLLCYGVKQRFSPVGCSLMVIVVDRCRCDLLHRVKAVLTSCMQIQLKDAWHC